MSISFLGYCDDHYYFWQHGAQKRIDLPLRFNFQLSYYIIFNAPTLGEHEALDDPSADDGHGAVPSPPLFNNATFRLIDHPLCHAVTRCGMRDSLTPSARRYPSQ